MTAKKTQSDAVTIKELTAELSALKEALNTVRVAMQDMTGQLHRDGHTEMAYTLARAAGALALYL